MSARDEAVEMIRRICPAHLSRDEYGQILAEKFDAHRTEVHAEDIAILQEAAAKKQAAGHWSAAGIRQAIRHLERATEATVPDFFQPGHSYTHRDDSTFRCVAVTTHPGSGERVALGWHTDTADWTFVGVRNINHWTHEYDGVQAPTEAGEAR